MFGRKPQPAPPAAEEQPARLKDAIRAARIESAERSSVVVDLRDAELARLELLDEALDPLFTDIPVEIELFDRGVSHGDTPRLWIDAIAHVAMGRDKRTYRFVQDGRYGRKIIAESLEPDEIVDAVTKYVARRLVERERALAQDSRAPTLPQEEREARVLRSRRRWRAFRMFVLGLVIGTALVIAAALLLTPPP